MLGKFVITLKLIAFGALVAATTTSIAAANPIFQQQTGATCDTCHRGDQVPTSQTLTPRGAFFKSCGYNAACAGFTPQPNGAPPTNTPPNYQQQNNYSPPPSPYVPPQPAPYVPPQPAPYVPPQPAPYVPPQPAPYVQPNYQAGLPPGGYLASCSDAHMVDGALEANCRRADQSIRTSILANAASCRGDISNINGQLTCIGAPQPVARKSWNAIAVSDYRGEDPGKGYWAYSSGYTKVDASNAALALCQKNYNDPNNCEVKVVFQNQCGAYANSKKDSGSGTGRTLQEAETNALLDCGKFTCKIVKSGCVN